VGWRGEIKANFSFKIVSSTLQTTKWCKNYHPFGSNEKYASEMEVHRPWTATSCDFPALGIQQLTTRRDILRWDEDREYI